MAIECSECKGLYNWDDIQQYNMQTGLPVCRNCANGENPERYANHTGRILRARKLLRTYRIDRDVDRYLRANATDERSQAALIERACRLCYNIRRSE